MRKIKTILLANSFPKTHWMSEVFIREIHAVTGAHVEHINMREGDSYFRKKFSLITNNSFLFNTLLPERNKAFYNTVIRVNPDVVFVMKGENIFPHTITKLKNKTNALFVLRNTDDPFMYPFVSKYVAGSYDIVLTNSMSMIERYKKLGTQTVKYVSFAFNPENTNKNNTKKYLYDVTFIGTYNALRHRVLKQLTCFDLHIWGPRWKKYIVGNKIWRHYHPERVFGSDYTAICQKSKICINLSVTNKSMNMRHFELAGMGAFQITNNTEGLNTAFTIDEEVVVYNDYSELRNKVRYYLNNDSERENIKNNAQKKALQYYTYHHRIKEMFSIIHDEFYKRINVS